MSAPFVSGAMALVKQYVEQKKLASTETDKAALVNALLMSTAERSLQAPTRIRRASRVQAL